MESFAMNVLPPGLHLAGTYQSLLHQCKYNFNPLGRCALLLITCDVITVVLSLVKMVKTTAENQGK